MSPNNFDKNNNNLGEISSQSPILSQKTFGWGLEHNVVMKNKWQSAAVCRGLCHNALSFV